MGSVHKAVSPLLVASALAMPLFVVLVVEEGGGIGKGVLEWLHDSDDYYHHIDTGGIGKTNNVEWTTWSEYIRVLEL